jgi:hypothetical protein
MLSNLTLSLTAKVIYMYNLAFFRSVAQKNVQLKKSEIFSFSEAVSCESVLL